MGEVSQKSVYLEYLAIAVVIMGMLSHSEIATSQDYNVALGFFLIYAAHVQNGRANALGALFVLVSILVDIIVMARFGEAFRINSGGQFGLAMYILNLFVKIGILAVQYLLFTQVFVGSYNFPGASREEGGYDSPSFMADQSHLTDVHYQGQSGGIGSSYQQAADAPPQAGGHDAAPNGSDPNAPKY